MPEKQTSQSHQLQRSVRLLVKAIVVFVLALFMMLIVALSFYLFHSDMWLAVLLTLGSFIAPAVVGLALSITPSGQFVARLLSRIRQKAKSRKILTIMGALQLPVVLAAIAWAYVWFSISGRDKQEIQRWASENIALLFCGIATPLLIVAYISIYVGSIVVGLYFASIVAYVSLLFAVQGLSLEDGALAFFGKHKAKATPPAILGCSLVFACAFGAIHYGVWSWMPGEYNNMKGWQDALYFSITTMATVGYGDISPLGHLAKWLCVVEIVSGFTLLVVAVNASMAVWIQNHEPQKVSHDSNQPL